MAIKFGANSKKKENETIDLMEDFGAPAPDQESAEDTVSQNGTLQMKLSRPADLKEATKIADCLKGGQTVVLNLDDMKDDMAKRMIDYIAGVIYAIDGKIERPSERTFLLTPKGVDVDEEAKKS